MDMRQLLGAGLVLAAVPAAIVAGQMAGGGELLSGVAGTALALGGLGLGRIGRGPTGGAADIAAREGDVAEMLARIAFDRSADPILVAGPDGFLACNDAAVRFLGARDRTEIIGLQPARLSPPVQPDGSPSEVGAVAHLRAALAKGFSRFEWTHCRLDRTPVPVEVTLVAFEHQGRPLAVVYWRDLTRVVEEREAGRHMAEEVIGRAEGFARRTDEMQSRARSLAVEAHRGLDEIRAADGSAAQVSDEAQAIAAATGQLAASIGEIGARMAEADAVTRSAGDEATRADALVQELAGTAGRIGTVVSLINQIASQTNLLALNATIEAARAGAAGKGFAVVAGEVKSLATQTARATEEIAGQIASVQEQTRGTVEAIQNIGAVIARLRDISSAIAAGTEEQGATTRDIAGRVTTAAEGARKVAVSIGRVREAADESGRVSQEVLAAASGLEAEFGQLKTLVGTMLHR
ncbi:methyl-accepting chemotaxis protein (plasmid) [Tistrella mobilis]|uniref:methyl-accepting chemotaxis protein n=1 Tax=Tistrella mobilis TaxID=171437 RepID=UPI00355839C0